MISEKMLEYLMLADILNNDTYLASKTAEALYPRYIELRDEFIKEHMPTVANIKNPVTDNKGQGK